MRRQSAAQPSLPVQRPFAAPPSPVSLQKRERIKDPENASIARFDGLGCYQVRSEKAPDFGTRAKQPNLPAANAGVRRVGEKPARSKRCLAACGRLRKPVSTPAMRRQPAAQLLRPFDGGWRGQEKACVAQGRAGCAAFVCGRLACMQHCAPLCRFAALPPVFSAASRNRLRCSCLVFLFRRARLLRP